MSDTLQSIFELEKTRNALAVERDSLRDEPVRKDQEIRNLRAELGEVAAAIGLVEFMDPPDGGSVTLCEQIVRMRAEIDRLRKSAPEATSDRVASIASRGLQDPASLTPEEIKAVCGSALTQIEEK